MFMKFGGDNLSTKNVKLFLRLQGNFETTMFLAEKYSIVAEKYFDMKYDDDIDDDKSRYLENELKHYNKILCASIDNDIAILNTISDEKGEPYKNKNGFKTLYKKLESLMNKNINFDDGKIKIKDFLHRNRIKINHADSSKDEMNYVDYYNSIISYHIYDQYLFYIVDVEQKIIDAIEKSIGNDKINAVRNNEQSKQIISNNYFKAYRPIIKDILNSLKDSQMDNRDFNAVKDEVKKVMNEKIEKKLLDNDKDSLKQLENCIIIFEKLVDKYSLKAKIDSNSISNEQHFLKAIFDNNNTIVENLLTELIEIMKKILYGVRGNKEKMLNNLYGKKKEISDTTIR